MMNKAFYLAPAAALSIFLACSGGDRPGQGGGAGHTTTSTTAGDGCSDVVAQIFAPKCGNAGCHGPHEPAQGLDLVSPGVAERVLNKPGKGCSGTLANADYPTKSLLYEKLLAAPSCGARMPLGSALSGGEIACVRGFIAAQATGGAGGKGGAGTGGFGGFGGAEADMGTCVDGLRNGVETDVDCGGLCPLCPVGKGCSGPTDCQSFACAGGVCVAAACADGAQNGAETDLDCGGPACPPCAGGDHCLTGADCASMVCQPNGACAASCTDGVKDGLEKGVDCGGLCPQGCSPGTACDVATDCASHICAAGACATPTCGDMVANGNESDIDCGGSCGPCPLGKHCNTHADCATGGCVGHTCADMVYISEVRTHGKDGNGFVDELVELYNPGSTPVTLTPAWKLTARNAVGGCQDMGVGQPLFVGSGQVIPPHGHMLVAGVGYMQSPAPDATLLNSGGYGAVPDAGSVSLLVNGAIVDSLCYFLDASTMSQIMSCSSPYPCIGTPVSNAQALSGVDASLERKPGGALGNGQSTGDNAADFQLVMPAKPQNLASPPVP